jgi:peptidoglycan/LPS O-acetylase OafA/YrhL
MKLLLLLLVVALLLGPLRRLYLRHARFTIPATIGGLVGLILGAFIAAQAGLPSPLGGLLAMVAAGALAVHAGESCKAWCDRVLGPKEKKSD